MRASSLRRSLLAAALALVVAAPARAELRISDLAVFLNDHEVTVHVVLRGLKLTPASALDPNAVIYVRVDAEAALNGENTFLARMAGTAEQTSRQSDYRTIQRVQ